MNYYLPDLVMTISVPRVWNCSQRSLDSRTTLGSSPSSYRIANVAKNFFGKK